MHWYIDGNNVMGAAGDGWWNDPQGAAERLAGAIADWTDTLASGPEGPQLVTVVFDGRPQERIARLAGGNFAVEFAKRSGRDAADDRIVDLVADDYRDEPDIEVVTSDRGLKQRLPPGVGIEGAGRFRERIGLTPGPRGGSRRRRR